jgi:cyclase
MQRAPIAAKIFPDVERRVAGTFADSDLPKRPASAQVRRRSLCRLDDLYPHPLPTRYPR